MNFRLLANCLLALGVFGQCSNPVTRKEWRQLSDQEQSAYIDAVKQIKARPEGPQSNPSQWNFDQFAKVHYDYQADNHSKAPFLPWHRIFIQRYEDALKSINQHIVLPYWDWTVDSQNPASSDIFKAFGLNGNPAKDNCMTTGVAANWTVTGINH